MTERDAFEEWLLERCRQTKTSIDVVDIAAAWSTWQAAVDSYRYRKLAEDIRKELREIESTADEYPPPHPAEAWVTGEMELSIPS